MYVSGDSGSVVGSPLSRCTSQKEDDSVAWASPLPLAPESSGSESVNSSRSNYRNDKCLDLESVDEAYVESVIKECQSVVRGMMWRVFYAVCIFFVVLIFQAICVWNSDRVYTKYTTSASPPPLYEWQKRSFNMSPLYDHLQVAFMSWYGNTQVSIRCADVLIAVLCILVCGKVLFSAPLMFGCQMVIRYVLLMSQVYLLRGVFIAATVVPTPAQECKVFDQNANFLAQIAHVVQGYFSITDTCTDLIISGHTAGSTLFMEMFVMHNNMWHLNTAVVIIVMLIYVMLIVARAHYTIDVMFGVLLALHLYVHHLRIVSRVGRSTCKGIKLGNSFFSIICRAFSRFEMVEERIQLYVRLRHLKETTDDQVWHANKLAFYYNIFGIEDNVEPTCIYKGFDRWSKANFRLIGRAFARSKEPTPAPVPKPAEGPDTRRAPPDDTPTTNNTY